MGIDKYETIQSVTQFNAFCAPHTIRYGVKEQTSVSRKYAYTCGKEKMGNAAYV